MEEQESIEQASKIIDITTFAIVVLVQGTLFGVRRFKLDIAAIVTLLSYLVVMLIRFLRTFINFEDGRTNPIQVGINIICNTLISSTIYYFAFEMQLVRILLERGNGSSVREREYSEETAELVRRNRLLNYTIIGISLVVQGVIYATLRMLQEYGKEYGTAGKIVFYITVFSKVPLDAISFYVFLNSFLYFLTRKQKSLKREALGLSPFNIFIVISVYTFLALRVLGTIWTATNAVITMTDIYDTHDYTFFRIITSDIFFPLRDFLESLFFAYLFFYQSKTNLCPKSLGKLNSQYFENMALPAAVNKQESLMSSDVD